MRIRWNYDRKKWLICPGEISEAETNLLKLDGKEPGYFDDWDGNVYFYERNFPVGELLNFCHRYDIHLEILY